MTGLDGLWERFPHDQLTPLDQGRRAASRAQADWQRDGYTIHRGLIGGDLIDAYCAAWKRTHGRNLQGWGRVTCYRDCAELADIATAAPLAQAITEVIGEPGGLHLVLSGWRSTGRQWHPDGYLNPDHVADWYAAAWIALDEIHPDSGPFELVAGSHRWPETKIREDRIRAALGPDGATSDWPWASERILTPAVERLITARRVTPIRPQLHRGDVLIWHARLLHRGPVPNDRRRIRRAVICHYSGIGHRPDMPPAVRHGDGWIFPL